MATNRNTMRSVKEPPSRAEWKRDIAPYVVPDERRSLLQIAAVVIAYVGIWAFAWLVGPGPIAAIAIGLVATVPMIRMYSLFHDLTHSSLFESRTTNARWGHLLGFLLFTPYRWWQRQHSLHHAHTGNLDKRGPGEIYTMTVAEYEAAPLLHRLAYRIYRNPFLILLVGPTLVFLFDRRFPRRGMSGKILASVIATNIALVGLVAGLIALVGAQTFLLIQGTTLVVGGAIAAWLLYVQHQYEETYYQAPDKWQFELAALQGSSYIKLPRLLAWAVGNTNFHHVHHLSSRVPNYRLRAAHEQLEIFANTPVVTLSGSIGTFRLKLWDEESASLVRFPTRATDMSRRSARTAEG